MTNWLAEQALGMVRGDLLGLMVLCCYTGFLWAVGLLGQRR